MLIVNKEQKDDVCVLSHVRLFMTLWTIAGQPLCPWDFSGKTTGMGWHYLPRGSFPPRDQTHIFCVFCISREILYPYAIGEVLKDYSVLGNGNPLQRSCLENPRDGGAWWAAIYGVTQSQTRLKQLSSSNSSNLYGGKLCNVSKIMCAFTLNSNNFTSRKLA